VSKGRLSSIDTIDTGRRRPPWRSTGVLIIVLIASTALLVIAAIECWDLRRYHAAPDWVYLIGAVACVVIPMLVVLTVARRDADAALVFMIAIVAPIVVWLFVLCASLVSMSIDHDHEQRADRLKRETPLSPA
jgi:choline-glycine betaine transporter